MVRKSNIMVRNGQCMVQNGNYLVRNGNLIYGMKWLWYEMTVYPVGYHILVSVKALNSECRDPVLFVSYREHVLKIPHKNEYRK